jgi:hypothetical protein
MTDENIEKIISSDEARRLRQDIDKAINNYANLFERQGLIAHVGSRNEYPGHLTRAYEIMTTIAVGERKA